MRVRGFAGAAMEPGRATEQCQRLPLQQCYCRAVVGAMHSGLAALWFCALWVAAPEKLGLTSVCCIIHKALQICKQHCNM